MKTKSCVDLKAKELSDEALQEAKGGFLGLILAACGVNGKPKSPQCKSQNVQWVSIGKLKHVTHCDSRGYQG